MITEFFLSLAAQVVGWVAGLFPAWEDASVLNGFAGFVTTAASWFVGLGVWVEWPVLIGCISLQVVVTLLAFSTKGLRAAIAHIPLFGGAGD